MVIVDWDRCAYCGGCVSVCPIEALTLAETRLTVNESCIDCGDPVTACPVGALRPEDMVFVIRRGDFFTGAGEVEVRARVVIAADGVEAQVGRWAGVAAAAIAAGDVSARFLRRYEERWSGTVGRKMERNYRLRGRFPPERRTEERFVRAFTLAAAG